MEGQRNKFRNSRKWSQITNVECCLSSWKISTLVVTCWHFKMTCPSRHFLKLLNLLFLSPVKVMQNIMGTDLNLAQIVQNWSSYNTNRVNWAFWVVVHKYDNKIRSICIGIYASWCISVAWPLLNTIAVVNFRSNLMWSCKCGPKASPLILSQLMPVMRTVALTDCHVLTAGSWQKGQELVLDWLKDWRNSWTSVIITSVNKSPADCCFCGLGETVLST